ncbi:MAG: YdjY domain-containing protein [Planctomycetota bacterium]|nr:YdjY domain-containing protein [Planctomycetota bacterium]
MRPKAGVCLAGVFLLVGGGCHQAPRAPSRIITPFDGLVVLPDVPAIEIQAWTCLDAGWLEQIACSPATREHESLVVIKPRPSEIHAAMLLAGFQPGSPGMWSYDNDALEFTPPTGDRLDVFVRYESASGETIEEPIRNWIQDHLGRPEFPDDPWVFGGSAFSPNPQGMDPGEQYVADMTGSIVGLVTFGDEVIGFSRVWADQQAVQPPQWQVRSDHVPPLGTEVALILRKAVGDGADSP